MRRRGGDTLMLAGGLLGGAVFAVGLLAVVLGLRLRRAERTATAPVRVPADIIPGDWPRADVIVVFGAEATEDGPCAELRARLDHSADLWRLGVAPQVLVSGGVAAGIDEVDVMSDYLVGLGVPSDVVRPLRPGDNTRVLLRSLRALGDRCCVAVSSPYHTLRVRTEARRQGLRIVVSAPPSTPETRHGRTYWTRFSSELVALVWYALPLAWTENVDTSPGSLRHVVPSILAGQEPVSALLPARLRRPR